MWTAAKPKEFVVVSGKGGTHKVCIIGSSAALLCNVAPAHREVIAAALHRSVHPRGHERPLVGGTEVWARMRRGGGEGNAHD